MKFLWLSFFLVWVNPVSAQEKEQSGETQQTAAITPHKEAAKTPRKSNSDDYKASEEISEDLSVSFPVDI
ncbi:hypothetical protein ACJJIF_18020 [Microbulbifer sp. SSSA002]|uniref:hypothetical protein n=1 Tax=Microbulbifer sp. SSSA002 TaxID=3243376 RepID=UPI004039301D